jgi:hypothetical protein
MTESICFTTIIDELSLSSNALAGIMQDVLFKGRAFRFRAMGWSMSPFILDGDVITVEPLCDGTPEVGDIVAFINPKSERLIVHRIVSREKDVYCIQGDNQAIDGKVVVRLEHIVGRITSIERAGRNIRLGLGPEKRIIALFSRKQLLQSALVRLRPLSRPLRRILF